MTHEELKKRYPFTCAACGKKLEAAPSLIMSAFGINSGSGKCSACGAFLHLEIVPDLSGTEMKSEIFDEYAKRELGEKVGK